MCDPQVKAPALRLVDGFVSQSPPASRAARAHSPTIARTAARTPATQRQRTPTRRDPHRGHFHAPATIPRMRRLVGFLWGSQEPLELPANRHGQPSAPNSGAGDHPLGNPALPVDNQTGGNSLPTLRGGRSDKAASADHCICLKRCWQGLAAGFTQAWWRRGWWSGLVGHDAVVGTASPGAAGAGAVPAQHLRGGRSFHAGSQLARAQVGGHMRCSWVTAGARSFEPGPWVLVTHARRSVEICGAPRRVGVARLHTRRLRGGCGAERRRLDGTLAAG